MTIQPVSQPTLTPPQRACGCGSSSGDEVRLGEREQAVQRVSLGELAAHKGSDLFAILDKAIQAVRCAPLSALDEERLKKLAHDIPKVDLHRHLEGAIEPHRLVEIALKHNLPLPSYDVEQLRPHIQITPTDRGLLDFLKKFEPIGNVFKDKEVIADITYAAVADAHDDNVKYLELRYSPQYMAKAHNLNLDDVVTGVFEGMQRAADDFDTKVGLMLIVERWDTMDRAREVEELAVRHQDKGIVALDLANDEVHFPPGPFGPIFQDARKAGLKITVHAGEAGDTAADNVRVSIEQLGADRIGHGVRAYLDPAVEQLAIDKQVVFEMCPTSNVQTDSIEKLEDHPIRRYHEKGLPVTINTDDPSISGITLSHDVALVAREFDFSLNDLRRMEQNGIDSAFTDEASRQNLTRSFDEGFRQAERSLVSSLSLEELESLALRGVEAGPGSQAEKDALRAQIQRELNALRDGQVRDQG
ncbi:MAG: adenosine deaminase [Candidatus Eremiobacterota bacterium]